MLDVLGHRLRGLIGVQLGLVRLLRVQLVHLLHFINDKPLTLLGPLGPREIEGGRALFPL